ncbi:hypothetical protein [Sphingomonas sp. GB1N7]|uniref:hypothetical protein n=1 Tax=Parasphingomonas caseinilytica TaxID=3096158 RepID=UPI002FCA29E3
MNIKFSASFRATGMLVVSAYSGATPPKFGMGNHIKEIKRIFYEMNRFVIILVMIGKVLIQIRYGKRPKFR